MIKFIREIFKAKANCNTRSDEFIWTLAEALYRDEKVSIGAIPLPIKEQDCANRYYDVAKYLIQFVTDNYGDKENGI